MLAAQARPDKGNARRNRGIRKRASLGIPIYRRPTLVGVHSRAV